MAATLLMLGACGFHPMYGKANHGAVVPEIAAVGIGIIPDRSGQQLRNMLLDRLTPAGAPAEPRYTLDIALSEARQELGIREDETATRANLIVNARYTLTHVPTRTVLIEGRTRSINSFDIVTSEFATLIAERDARERGLRVISNAIAARLAAYFDHVREVRESRARERSR